MNQDSNEQSQKRGTLLCLISLACELLPVILTYIVYLIFEIFPDIETAIGEKTLDALTNIWEILFVISVLAGVALLIYVRVKYPRHTLGRILMWIYIAFAVLCLVAIVVSMILCYLTCMACENSWQSCADTCRGCE